MLELDALQGVIILCRDRRQQQPAGSGQRAAGSISEKEPEVTRGSTLPSICLLFLSSSWTARKDPWMLERGPRAGESGEQTREFHAAHALLLPSPCGPWVALISCLCLLSASVLDEA